MTNTNPFLPQNRRKFKEEDLKHEVEMNVAWAVAMMQKINIAQENANAILAIPARSLSKLALRMGMYRLGLGDIEDWTPENITQSINDYVLYDYPNIKFRNLFDADITREDLRRNAIALVAAELGLGNDIRGIPELKAAVIKWANQYVMQEVEKLIGSQLSSELQQYAKPMLEVQLLINAVGLPQLNDPEDFSKHGIANRAAQARYRAKHKRRWIKKPWIEDEE